MTHTGPLIIESECISHAWGQVFLHAFEKPRSALPPIMLSVTALSDDAPVEDVELRDALDTALTQHRMNSVRVSGLMIFPFDMWTRRGKQSCKEFSDFCVEQLVPRLKAADQRNRYGTYFERMMRYSGARKGKLRNVNQLQFIIDLLKRPTRSRHSALQIACFDPVKDHTGQAVRGFPCLQQIGVAQDRDGRIAINAYYPTQYIFDRGYGNYLGLCHLGQFLAEQADLEFSRLNCFIGQPDLGKVRKGDLRELAEFVRSRIDS